MTNPSVSTFPWESFLVVITRTSLASWSISTSLPSKDTLFSSLQPILAVFQSAISSIHRITIVSPSSACSPLACLLRCRSYGDSPLWFAVIYGFPLLVSRSHQRFVVENTQRRKRWVNTLLESDCYLYFYFIFQNRLVNGLTFIYNAGVTKVDRTCHE